MNESELQQLFEKYQNGQCSQEEELLVEEFLNSFQKESHWIESTHGNKQEVEDRIFNKIESKIDFGINEPKRKKFIPTSAWLVAASVSVLILLGVMSYNEEVPEPTIAKSEIALITRKAERGQKYSISLSDGTKVRLNSESYLIFPEKFTDNLREVELVGEAFFDVAKNPKRPFRVKTKQLTTQVLGTSFNIRAFDNEKESVTVATGKVKVTSVENDLSENISKEGVLLLPNQQVTFDPSTGYLKNTNVDLEKFISWKDDIILFDHISMKEAASILEKWYDVKIIFAKPSLKNCNIIRSSYKNESLENVLKSLKFIQGIDYRFASKKEVVLSGDICKK